MKLKQFFIQNHFSKHYSDNCFQQDLIKILLKTLNLKCSFLLTYFSPESHFLPPENLLYQRFSDIFKGYRNVTLDKNGLMSVSS